MGLYNFCTCGHQFIHHIATYDKKILHSWCSICFDDPIIKLTGKANHPFKIDNLRYLEELSK